MIRETIWKRICDKLQVVKRKRGTIRETIKGATMAYETLHTVGHIFVSLTDKTVTIKIDGLADLTMKYEDAKILCKQFSEAVAVLEEHQ